MKVTPIRPNAGVRAAYEARLQTAIADMHRSLRYWITAKYRAEMAMDATAAPERDDDAAQLDALTDDNS